MRNLLNLPLLSRMSRIPLHPSAFRTIVWSFLLALTTSGQELSVLRRASTFLDGPGFDDTKKKQTPDILIPFFDADEHDMASWNGADGRGFARAEAAARASGSDVSLIGTTRADAGEFLPIGSVARCSAQFEKRVRVRLDPLHEDRYSFRCICSIN